MNANTPPQPDEEAVQEFASTTVEVWSRTLVAFKRKIETLERRVIALEQDKARSFLPPPKGRFDA